VAGSRQPGPTSDSGRPVPQDNGTLARSLAPGGGVVGSAAHTALNPAQRGGLAQGAVQETLIDATGVLKSARVVSAIAKTIERGKMTAVRGVIVHQTGGGTAQSTLDSYKSPSANGAHFLIDKDGTIYQTASLFQRTRHVGKLKARCLVEKACDAADIRALKKYDPADEHQRESSKSVPQRFPSNEDSIGIELVGSALKDPGDPKAKEVYETVTDPQNASLKWLIEELTRLLGVPLTEIFRHPDVSRKNVTEASSAKW
jgi:N-acetyl-anhydromuramyl-L-alanine amidase AmpD